MSFSGSIDLDPARISESSDALEERAAGMASRRAGNEESVEALLATWRGATALRFGELWTEWRDNADAVIDGLGATADSLRSARDLTVSADSHVGSTNDHLRGRLG